MKQAILVVAFGSTVDSAREHNIDSVVEYIRKSYPDYTVELAFPLVSSLSVYANVVLRCLLNKGH